MYQTSKGYTCTLCDVSHTHAHFSLVLSPDHTRYASSERGSGVIHRFSWPCRATPPTWKHVINIQRWLEPTTVLFTVNCKLKPTWENVSRQHWRWFMDSNRFSNRTAQCKFNANPMRIDRVHTALCGTEFMHTRWLQVATPPHNYHGTLIRSLLQPAIILLLQLSRYMKHSHDSV